MGPGGAHILILMVPSGLCYGSAGLQAGYRCHRLFLVDNHDFGICFDPDMGSTREGLVRSINDTRGPLDGDLMRVCIVFVGLAGQDRITRTCLSVSFHDMLVNVDDGLQMVLPPAPTTWPVP